MLVPTGVMFVLSRRFGALADRFGPRLFMGIGPIVSACGLLLLMRVDASVSFAGDLLPALLVFSVGLSISVAPLTAAVLADADEAQAGIASAVNNAVARTAALVATAAVGAVLASSFAGRVEDKAAAFLLPPAAQAVVEETKDRTLGVAAGAGIPAELTRATSDAAVDTFHLALMIGAVLMAAGGVLGLVGIRNPPRDVCAEDCAGGQFAGQPVEAGRSPAPAPASPVVEPAPA
jgi:MFS family permease